jgi:hypothetical protein
VGTMSGLAYIISLFKFNLHIKQVRTVATAAIISSASSSKVIPVVAETQHP